MKNLVRYLQIIPATFLVVGCANEKTPVTDIEKLRQDAKTSEANAQKPQPVQQPQRPPPQIKEVAVPGETRVVDRPVPVIKEVIKEVLVKGVSPSDIILTKPAVGFQEGVPGSFTFKVRCTLPDCTPSLKAENLPEGAELKPAGSPEPSVALYQLNWTPRIGITDPNLKWTSFQPVFKATARAKDEKINKLLEEIVNPEIVYINVGPANIDIQDIRISGVPQEIQEGKEFEFTVTAKIAGIDSQGSKKPTLVRNDDERIQSAGGPIEISGANFIRGPVPGDFERNEWVWKMKFSTKGFARPSALNSDTARAGVALQVCYAGVCNEVPKYIKVDIKYPKVEAPAAAAPATTEAPAAKSGSKPAPKPAPKPVPKPKTLAPPVGKK